MLKNARAFGARRTEMTTSEEALNRFYALCCTVLSPLERSASKVQAYIRAFAALLAEGLTIKGGIIRDLLGGYDEDIRDIDIPVDAAQDDETFSSHRNKICDALEELGLSLVSTRWQGLKCCELFFTWKGDLGELPKEALTQMHPDLICVQLSMKNGFANKKPDFSVCQFAVRCTSGYVIILIATTVGCSHSKLVTRLGRLPVPVQIRQFHQAPGSE